MQVTEEIAQKVLDVVDAGLCKGLGEPIPGQMCIEAAVCYVLQQPHGHSPSGVYILLRTLAIGLNELEWSNNKARARGMRRFAVAQLGTDIGFDGDKFADKLVLMVMTKWLPKSMSSAAALCNPDFRKTNDAHKERIVAATKYFAAQTTLLATRLSEIAERLDDSLSTNIVGHPVNCLNYNARSAALELICVTYGVGVYVAEVVVAFATAIAACAVAEIDTLLGECVEDVVQILLEMKTPGSQFLYLTEEKV